MIKTRGFPKRFGKLNNSFGENKKPKIIKTIDANKNCNIEDDNRGNNKSDSYKDDDKFNTEQHHKKQHKF